jgi:phage shock protein PspC (stress-responsive transcriptional regulator)
MSCKEAMAAVVNVVQTGGAIPDEQREHLKTCARCRELLESANQFDAAIHDEHVPEPAIDDGRLASEVRGVYLREMLRRSGVAALVAVAVVAALGLIVNRYDDIELSDVLRVAGIAAVVSTIPVIFFYVVIAALRDRNGNRICKRLKPGRALSGVCLGLSEATGISVNIYRLAFVALAFIKGAGILLYIVLDLAMPVHPDDRQYLLRFKLRRAMQRRFAHADNDPR